MDSEQQETRPLAHRLMTNAAAYVGGDVFTKLVNFLTAVLVVRSLGSEIYGYYSFIYVFLAFFETFTTFGLNNILTREIAQHPDEVSQWLGSALILRLILIFISIPFACVLVNVLGYPAPVRLGVALASLQLFLVLRMNFEAIFRVKLLVIYPAFWNGVRAVLNLLLVGAIVLWRPSLSLFILSAFVSGAVALVGLAIASQKRAAYSLKWDGKRISCLFRQCFPLLASGLLTQVCLRTDVFLLSKMRGFEEVGYYQAAVRITESFSLISASLLISIYPLLSEYFVKDPVRFQKLAFRTGKIFLITAVPLAIGGLFVSHELMTFLFGKSYASAGTALMIHLWYAPASFIGGLLVNILYAARKQMVDVGITVLQIGVNLALNFTLIPRFGYNGAAAAAVLSAFFAVLVMTIYLTKKSFVVWPSLPRIFMIVKFNLLFFVLLFLFKYWMGPNFGAVIALGVLSFGALIFIFKVVSWQDIQEYAGGKIKR